ncbi:MAG: hypothetical protein K0Q50_731 [Vampirovibrio sp.]|jgi:hypothetical protein|nr:hypothetical protein [Vampirovibrio sp.]
MEARPKYIAVEAVDEESVMSESAPQVQPDWRATASKWINISINAVVCVTMLTACAIGGWQAHAFCNPPTHSYSEAQEALETLGYANAAQTLGEMEHVCTNGHHQKIACRLLILNSEEIAQKGTAPQMTASADVNVPGDKE